MQHQQKSAKCFAQIKEKFGAKISATVPHAFMPLASVPCAAQQPNSAKTSQNFTGKTGTGTANKNNLDANNNNCEHLNKRQRLSEEDAGVGDNSSYSNNSADDNIGILDAFSIDSTDNSTDSEATTNKLEPNKEMLRDWHKYTRWAKKHLLEDFSRTEVNAIDLAVLLRKTKASLKTYDELMAWHLRANGVLKRNQSLSKNKEYLSRKNLFKMLGNRFNYGKEKKPTIKEITLPHSKAKVQIVLNDPINVIQSLLTDPRITDDDYIFKGKSPLKGPKAHPRFISDLHTGQAYRDTYKALITDPNKQILLQVIFYIDAANTVIKSTYGEFWATFRLIPSTNQEASA